MVATSVLEPFLDVLVEGGVGQARHSERERGLGRKSLTKEEYLVEQLDSF